MSQTANVINNDNGNIILKTPLIRIPFTIFGPITVSLPSISLLFCFLTSIVFQFDEVKNIIPSISAITGVQPQRYIWRVSIALHSTPRFLIGIMYVNYYMQRLANIAVEHQDLFRKIVFINFIVYVIENSCLVLVSYISNVENYPVHEKIFVVFMFSALIYEFITLVLFKWSNSNNMTNDVCWSLKWKRIYFTLIMSFTAGLLFNFIRHRFYCITNAFSYFSACEYGIAFTNIAFHYTAATDFRNNVWYVGIPVLPQKIE